MSRIGKAKAWHWQQSTIAYVYKITWWTVYECNTWYV